MEIPVINRISDFKAGISSLHDPSFLSQLLTLSGVEKIYNDYNIWKWGALILALLASFTTIINRLKLLIIRLRQKHPVQLQAELLEDSDFDTETDVSCSSVSSSEDDQEREALSNSWNWRQVDENSRVRGSGHYVDDQWQNGRFTLRRRRGSIGDLFSWQELMAGGKSVVKLWDNLALGLGLDFDGGSENEEAFNVYDIDRQQKLAFLFGGAQAVSSSSSPAVVMSAGAGPSGRVSLGAWDTRVPCRAPSILAEWRPGKPVQKVADVNAGGVEKVYVRDDVTGELTVGDMRKATSPLQNLTESDVEKWWDADAVIDSGE